MNKIPTEKEMLEEVIFPIAGVALSIIVMVGGLEVLVTLWGMA